MLFLAKLILLQYVLSKNSQGPVSPATSAVINEYD